MTHLAATVPPAPQTPHATHRDSLETRYLQRRSTPLRKPVNRELKKNYLENLDKVFHYSVISGGALTWLAAGNLIAFP